MGDRMLSTAAERTDTLVDAALTVFAVDGFNATPIAAVARHAEISTAYAFKLFPTKVDLFVAAIDHCYDRIVDTLNSASALADPSDSAAALDQLGGAYAALITDRRLLMLQVHAIAATSEPRIRAAVRSGIARIVDTASEISGAPADEVQRFVALGQLCHLLTAIDAFDIAEPWATTLAAGLRHSTAER